MVRDVKGGAGVRDSTSRPDTIAAGRLFTQGEAPGEYDPSYLARTLRRVRPHKPISIWLRTEAEAVAIAQRVKPCAIVLFAKSPSCDREWGLAGRRLGELGVPLLVLGDIRGRPHLVSAVGRLRVPDDSRLQEPPATGC